MKIKTLFIAPYAAMTHLIDECRKKEHELEIDVKVGNLQEAVPLAQEGERQGYEVIISRGGTAKLIEPAVEIPVIDVHVSGYDMLRVLTLASDFPGKKAIVGFSNITLGAKAITDLLEIEIDVFTVEEAHEVAPLLNDLKLKNFELIMGDVVTIESAAKHNLKGILIQSGREAIFDAFQKAKSVYRLYEKKQMEISFLQSLLKEIGENLIVLDQTGKVIYEQWKDFSSCPVPREELLTNVQQEGNRNDEIRIYNDGERKIKLKRNRKEILGKNYYLYFFSEIKKSAGNLTRHIETIAQLPILVSQSKEMERCLNLIEYNLASSRFILSGEAGTGKRLLSRYIHSKKYAGRGLYLHLLAKHALMELDDIDVDIFTIYIHGLEQLTQDELSELKHKIDEMRNRNLTIIVSFDKENSACCSFMLDEQSVRINVPPLRERKADIRPLATYYIAAFHGTLGTSPIKIKDDAVSLLESYTWPGNVAELKIVLKDAVTEEKGYVIGKALISRLLEKKKMQLPAPVIRQFLSGTLDEIEKRIIDAIMEEENYNQTRVAERLGINRSTLWRKLKQ